MIAQLQRRPRPLAVAVGSKALGRGVTQSSGDVSRHPLENTFAARDRQVFDIGTFAAQLIEHLS